MNILDYTYDKYLDGECGLLDAHFHLSLVADEEKYFEKSADFYAISYGLLPSLYEKDCKYKSDRIQIGLGFHPWCIKADNIKKELVSFSEQFWDAEYIGEIGLDFSAKYVNEKDFQIVFFEEFCKLASKASGKVISIHAIKSTEMVLDMLSKYNVCENNTVIFHWFTGSKTQLYKAIEMGCYFSCGPKMLILSKGFELIREIPENKMFIETDMPWENKKIDAKIHYNALCDFLLLLREARINC